MITQEFMREKYKLKRKPFKDRIAREKWLDTWTNREEEVKQWEGVISDSISSDKNYLAFIIGNYGQGKTLSLMRIKRTAAEYEEILPILLNFKGEERSKPGLDFIFRIFKSIDFSKLAKDKRGKLVNAIETMPDQFNEVRTILDKICCGEGEIGEVALYFLRGEIIPTQSQLRKLEVVRKIDRIDVAKEYLAGFLTFAKGLGYTTLLLAIDEFEYLFSLVTKTQHSIYLALLRELYDFTAGMGENAENIANMVLFIAISESGWSYLTDLEKKERSIGGPIVPLRRRVDAEIELGPFNEAQTRELIEKRLRYNRVEGRFEDQPLIPFTESFVSFIHEETRGVLEKIIVRCDHVLDAG
jgi:hypothetical protein